MVWDTSYHTPVTLNQHVVWMHVFMCLEGCTFSTAFDRPFEQNSSYCIVVCSEDVLVYLQGLGAYVIVHLFLYTGM